ncbi:hypothetical protein PMIN01_12308 [Paraphaeosphaeria minitans]|uniref:Uncharacterized protein n=1 Tax=Paraphaeosphaeria minitans TaxID=565426 RepID=A0A9P6KKG6_9PLEO|nr:hypothetical protein PMIN01_12308 [Paraphaeosphaeria minitans]
MSGKGPPAPPALLPLQPSAPWPEPFIAYEGRRPGGGKGAAALTTAAYAHGPSRMVGALSGVKRCAVVRIGLEQRAGKTWAGWQAACGTSSGGSGQWASQMGENGDREGREAASVVGGKL